MGFKCFISFCSFSDDDVCQNVFIAITPAARMILLIVQMQLIFISTQQMPFKQHGIISKFGLMHLLATNLCEWLYVVIEEAKHEILHIVHLHHQHHDSQLDSSRKLDAFQMIRRPGVDGHSLC